MYCMYTMCMFIFQPVEKEKEQYALPSIKNNRWMTGHVSSAVRATSSAYDFVSSSDMEIDIEHSAESTDCEDQEYTGGCARTSLYCPVSRYAGLFYELITLEIRQYYHKIGMHSSKIVICRF